MSNKKEMSDLWVIVLICLLLALFIGFVVVSDLKSFEENGGVKSDTTIIIRI